MNFIHHDGFYKDGQVPFDDAWAKKIHRQTFNDLLGTVQSWDTCDPQKFPHSTNSRKAISSACKFLNTSPPFSISRLSAMHLQNTVDNMSRTGIVAARWLYELYALHATPFTEEVVDTKEAETQVLSEMINSFKEKTGYFCVFKVDGVTYVKVKDCIIPFGSICDVDFSFDMSELSIITMEVAHTVVLAKANIDQLARFFALFD
jgi:hypothetical protein